MHQYTRLVAEHQCIALISCGGLTLQPELGMPLTAALSGCLASGSDCDMPCCMHRSGMSCHKQQCAMQAVCMELAGLRGALTRHIPSPPQGPDAP